MMDLGFDLFYDHETPFVLLLQKWSTCARSEVVWVMHCSARLDPWLYEWPTRPMTPSIKPFSAGQHNPPLFFFSCKHTYRNRREAERQRWGPAGGQDRGQCYSKAGSGPHSREPISGCCVQEITDQQKCQNAKQ